MRDNTRRKNYSSLVVVVVTQCERLIRRSLNYFLCLGRVCCWLQTRNKAFQKSP